MAVDGLPNPHLHAICQCCRQWFPRREGSQVPIPSLNPLRWVLRAGARVAGMDQPTRFVCHACQGKSVRSGHGTRTALIGVVVMLSIITAIAAMAWWSGLFDSMRLP